MKKWTWLGTVMLAVMLVAAGCGKEEYPPVPINEEVDRCEICNMAIKDDAYATQLITKEGQSLKFDDLGCLNEWRVENGTERIASTYVRDFNSMEWIKYDKAYYVYDATIQTPMAYGIISFETEEAANQYISEHGVGTLMDANALANHSWAVNRDMMGSHSHDHGEDHTHGHSEGADHDGEVEHGTVEHGDHEAEQHGTEGHGDSGAGHDAEGHEDREAGHEQDAHGA